MNLIKKNLLATTFMLCGNVVVLNAQSFISDFLSEDSYINGAYPVDESLISYSFENHFDYDELYFQLRSSEGIIENMNGDTPDPGTVPIDDIYWFWIAATALYGFKIFHKKKGEIKPKRNVIFLSALVLIPLPLFSGNEYSFSLSANPSTAYLYGDVAGINRVSTSFDDLKLKHIRYMLGGGIRHKVNRHFSHKINFAYGHFVADERKNTRLSYRGYAYNTQLCQLWWQPELTLLNIQNNKAYLFTGIGIAHSSSKLTGSPIRPTDRFKSKETAALTPFGVGYETALSERFSLGAEIVCYYYFSDFIDGISTQFSSHNDVVGAVLFSFSYKIFKDNGLYSKKGGARKPYKCGW